MKLRIFIIQLIVFAFLSGESARAEEAFAAVPQEGRLITITRGIEIVLKDNRLIKVALPGNEMAYQDSLISLSSLLPQLSAYASKSYYMYQPQTKFGSINIPTADREPVSYGFDIYQTLFDFGKNLSNYRASKEAFKATEANTESIRRIATLEFVTAYFNLLETEKMIAVFVKEVDSLTSYLNDIEHLYEQGAAVKNDLLPAKVKLADANQRLIAARNRRQVASARLNNILAISLKEKVTVRDIEMSEPKFPDIEVAWSSAVAQRPEIAFYEDQIKSSKLRQRARAVENFPVLFLNGGYDYTYNNTQVHQDNYSLKLGAKWNIFDGAESFAQLSKERSKQKQLDEQKNKLVEDIKFEIEDSFYGLKDACEKVEVAKSALEQAEENVRFYRVKYNAGSATPTDVLEAITLQTRSQTNYYLADFELKRNYAKLMYSMGVKLAPIYERLEKEKK